MTTGGHPGEQSATRPISVAELLAKNGNIGSPPVTGRRRRRRGNAHAVTVAELTGEIPVIQDDEIVHAGDSEPDRDGDQPVAEHLADDRAAAVGLAEPEPRWPECPPQPRCAPGPQRSEYPRPVHRTDSSDAAQGRPGPASQSGAEQMSPDPVEHHDVGLDMLDAGRDGDLDEDGQDLDAEADLDDELTEERSRLSELLSGGAIVLQSILAVVFGAGLFIAFDQLWRWNNIVALVLAVLVTLGLVAAVQAVRKTVDVGSTLTAVAVGLLITLGPLALHAN